MGIVIYEIELDDENDEQKQAIEDFLDEQGIAYNEIG